MGIIEILLILIKTLGMEDAVKKTLINLLPAESAFESMLNTGINLWGIFFGSIELFGTVIVIALIAICLIMSLAPPDSIWFIKPYGGLYSTAGLTTVLPGLNKYIVGPQQKLALWLINIFTKPVLYILTAQISMAIAGLLLVDPQFISDVLTALFENPVASIGIVGGTLFWVAVIMTATSFTMVAGLFAYPIIELGNAFGNSITKFFEEMMYAALVIPPIVAFLYRIAFMMKAQDQPITAMVLWMAAIGIPVMIVMGGVMKALISIAIDVAIMYVLKGISAKGFLSGLQLNKLLTAGAVLNTARKATGGERPHRKGLPTRLIRTSKK
jgi:hypothetical protein